MSKNKASPADLPTMNDWQETLSCFFRAMLPALWLQTSEESRCIDQVLPVLQYLGLTKCGCRNLRLWSEASLKQYILWAAKDNLKDSIEPTTLEYQEFFACVTDFAKPDLTKDGVTGHGANVLLLADAAEALQVASNVRALKETIQAIRGHRKTVILIGKHYNLPAELQQDITVVPFDLPTRQEFKTIVDQVLSKYRTAKGYEHLTLADDQVVPFVRACAGVTDNEMRSILSLAVAKHRSFDEKAVNFALDEKARIVRRSNVLEVIKPRFDMRSVGGLENVKAWIENTTPIWNAPDQAHEYGLTLPSGLALIGIAGCGKSATAEALAAHWQLPLLKLDMGRAFGSLVGESEKNIREMIQVAQATAPCIVFIDELDKAFGGDSLDGGTSQRVFGTILNWLETKPDNVFVVATANDLRMLAKKPELLQRFAETFFVDLPDLRSRIEILNIHLAPKHALPHDYLVDVAKKLRVFSGREIRNVVRKALASSFKENLKHPTHQHLIDAAKLTVPTSITLKETIAELRKWCTSGRAIPAGALLEAEEKDAASFEQHGMPDLGG